MAIADTALNLLQTFGDAVTIEFAPSGNGGYDPITGDPVATVPGSVLTGYGYTGAYKGDEVDGATIKAGDIRLILSKITARPEVGSIVTVDGTTYRAMNVQNVRMKAADVIYIVQLRAGA
jgi:hypothetical protein